MFTTRREGQDISAGCMQSKSVLASKSHIQCFTTCVSLHVTFNLISSHCVCSHILYMQYTCTHSRVSTRYLHAGWIIMCLCEFQWVQFYNATALKDVLTCPASSVFIYRRSALDAVLDRFWYGEICLLCTTQGRDKPCLSNLSQVLRTEQGSVCLLCQTILSIYPCFTRATEETITTKDRNPIQRLMGVTQPVGWEF